MNMRHRLALMIAALSLAAAPARADTYLVVDLSGGTNAASYPVSYLSDVPAGGWTDEHKTDKLVLRKIPAGTFTMGSPTNELGRESDETQHEVTLTKDFYIGVFEVTQRQWELVMGNRPSYFNNAAYYASRAVEMVSYYEIRENPLPVAAVDRKGSAISPNWPQSSQTHPDSFMGKLRAKTGLATFDLPTEAQWEYACRAGTTTALNSGKNLTGTVSCTNVSEVGRNWYNGGSAYSQGCDATAGSAAVGTYLPNAWGLYDMHGNVWECCLDWQGAYPGAVTNPVGAASGTWRICRGGCWAAGYLTWGQGVKECRTAKRHVVSGNGAMTVHAFRAAMTLTDTHLVTLHPGDHGSITNANSGSSYVTNVEHGADFPAVTVIADAGWSFTGWNPPAPETVTSNYTGTAVYEAVAQSSFQLVRGAFTWQQAKAEAEARGGHLVTITSEGKWQRVLSAIGGSVNPDENWWLGATDEETEGVWKWVTGEPWGYTRWRSGEPNNLGDEDYLLMELPRNDFPWNDIRGAINAAIAGYILELPGGTPPPAPRPDISLSPTDLRILNASGVETANPSIGEGITLEVTLRNTGAAATTGDILVQAFHNGAPTNLAAYHSNDFSVVASAVVAESLGVGGSRMLQLAWTADAPARVATLTVVAEFATNRAASQAGTALPYPEEGYADNAVGRSIQIGSPPAGQYRIAVRPVVPPNMQSGLRYTLAGTAVYDWGSTSAVIGAQATIGVNGASYTNRTVMPNGAWSVLLNGLPAGDHVAHIRVDDGGRVGTTNVLLSVSPGPATVDLHVKQIAFESGTYRTSGETGYAVTGTPVVLKALIRNDGNTNSGNFTVDFRDYNDLVVSAVTTSLAAFSETWVTSTAGWPAQAGSHELTVVVDSGNSVTNETSESNNESGCVVIGAAALPDLIVSDIAWSPDSPTHGDTVTLTATVDNQGAVAVPAGMSFDTAFSSGGTVTTNLAAALAPGASIAVRTPWAATAGSHTVSATADSGSAIAEDSESNNNRTETLFVRQALPDLRPSYLLWGWRDVSGLSFSPTQPVAGETVTVTCDIYNSGTVPLASGRSFNAVFSADGIPFATNTVVLAAELAVNGKVATSTPWSGAAGSVTFAGAVDTVGVVTEENEGNNVTALGLTVYPAGSCVPGMSGD